MVAGLYGGIRYWFLNRFKCRRSVTELRHRRVCDMEGVPISETEPQIVETRPWGQPPTFLVTVFYKIFIRDNGSSSFLRNWNVNTFIDFFAILIFFLDMKCSFIAISGLKLARSNFIRRAYVSIVSKVSLLT